MTAPASTSPGTTAPAAIILLWLVIGAESKGWLRLLGQKSLGDKWIRPGG